MLAPGCSRGSVEKDNQQVSYYLLKEKANLLTFFIIVDRLFVLPPRAQKVAIQLCLSHHTKRRQLILLKQGSGPFADS
jgi:hypothetical protein